jgi:hypothetical protein
MEEQNQIALNKKYEIGFITNNKLEFKRKVRNLNLVTIVDELEHTPSINVLSRANEDVCRDEIVLLLIETNKFFNVKNGLDEETLYDVADLILSEYKHHTMYDLGLCFKMAKLGRFGKVYERLDGGVVMDWMKQYEKQRDKSIIRNAEDKHAQTKTDTYREKTSWLNFNQIK